VAEDIYFITENGTLVRTKDRILHRWAVDPDYYETLLTDIRAIEGASAVVSFPEVTYVDSGEDSRVFTFLRDSYRYSIENVPDLMDLPHENVLKFTIYCENCEEACADLISSHWSRDLKMAASGTQWIDICSPDAGKGAALAFLQGYLGVKKEETLYFGDNMNDLPAFDMAGIAATVANARPEVQERADLIAASYSELGVLKELERIIRS
jgi:HAD superfamily hydrolase (TIGR01484 family)